MRRICSLLCLAALCTASARAVTVYQATDGSTYTSTRPALGLDDGKFATDNPTPTTVTGIDVGWVVPSAGGTTPASFDVEVSFYDTVTGSANPVNSGYLGGVRLAYKDLNAGYAYNSGMFNLDTPIVFPDNSWGVQYAFYEPGTTTFSTRATPRFVKAPIVGSNNVGIFWRDVNGNGEINSDEGRNIGTSVFYLKMEGAPGQVLPEPGSIALLASSLLPIGLAFRRRK